MAHSKNILIIAEKPSVARDIAKVVHANIPGEGFFYGNASAGNNTASYAKNHTKNHTDNYANSYTVTWAVGHLVTLPEPHQIKAEWKEWSFAQLPMLPDHWPLTPVEKTLDQLAIVQRCMKNCDEIICATDAGREGELIFRYIYEIARSSKPVKRLWISSLTPSAIETGLRNLKPSADYDPSANAARARSRADWLFGMNLSRAHALTSREPLFVGRVQTPTLAMVVERDLKIRNFLPEDYFLIEAQFRGERGEDRGLYRGLYLGRIGETPDPLVAKEKHLPYDVKMIEALLQSLRRGPAKVEEVSGKTLKQVPPFLFDLTELQRNCNRLFGFPASRTLQIAQSLYEKFKLISYPRTDSRHISASVGDTLPQIVSVIRGAYEEFLAPDTGIARLGSRFIDDSKVSDHHAIIPTTTPAPATLVGDEKKVYDLICRRLLAAWQADFTTRVTTVITRVGKNELFKTLGTVVEVLGWKALDIKGRNRETESLLPSGLEAGIPVDLLSVDSLKKRTEPPPHLTDATLLTGMETAGRNLEDRELAELMRHSGIGTPATRAHIIETLLTRTYMIRQEKSLIATPLGHKLISTVHPSVKSPELTAKWEKKLGEIEDQKMSLEEFMRELEAEISARVSEIAGSCAPTSVAGARANVDVALADVEVSEDRPRNSPHDDKFAKTLKTLRNFAPAPPAGAYSAPSPGAFSATSSSAQGHDHFEPRLSSSTNFVDSVPPRLAQDFAKKSHPKVKREISTLQDLPLLLKNYFGFESFRKGQELVCRSVAEGRDVLLVMPTGAGKSVCYQVPGIARGGTTLVVSPLVALIEDQVAKLQSLGFSAERIHSGRKREESREVCQRYLAGELDFLFIAPERLSVPGFPEFLRRTPPTLIAIDEAHCISQWGHDFRPDYRLLGERLKELRPAPVIALTATATPNVQEDICRQLGLKNEIRVIQGFRRTNIAIEVAELSPGQRPGAISAILKDEGRLPAIVYAPTRKKAVELTETLSETLRCGSYHAGMSASARDKVQTKFLSNELDVMVATVAFGMGIDKPNVRTVVHAASPGSVEGYYQEIGRAGRDGQPSKAYLLHSFGDQKTHDFFFEMNYPEESKLRSIFRELGTKSISKETVRRKLSSMDLDTFERALEQLWVHRGVIIDPDENMILGTADWQRSYQMQREQKRKHLKQMTAFTSAGKCRMLHLVSHFGDQNDSNEACGTCDICDPQQQGSLNQRRNLSALEQGQVKMLLAILAGENSMAAGRLYQVLLDSKVDIERRDFENLLTTLERAGWLEALESSFDKDGKTITYRRLSVTGKGERVTPRDIEQLEVSSVAKVAKTKTKSKAKIKTKLKTRAKETATEHQPKAQLRPDPDAEKSTYDDSLFEPLRLWRLGHARQLSIPAFRILTDRALLAICEHQPTTKSELLEISGINRKSVSKYADEILQIIQEH